MALLCKGQTGKGLLLSVENAALVSATAMVHNAGPWLRDAVCAFIRANRRAVQATDGGRLLRERHPRLAAELFDDGVATHLLAATPIAEDEELPPIPPIGSSLGSTDRQGRRDLRLHLLRPLRR
jgi:hypothetical protein